MSEYLITSANSADKCTVSWWNYNTGSMEHSYVSKCTAVRNSLRILNGEHVLIAEHKKPLLDVWAINKRDVKSRLNLPGPVAAVCVDPSSTYLALGIDQKVYIWHLNSGELLNVIEKSYQTVCCIKMSNTSDYLVVASRDGILMTFNFKQAVLPSLMGVSEPLYTRKDHTDAITDLSIGNFGCKSRLISISLDFTIRLYNLYNGDPLKVLILTKSLTCITTDSLNWKIYIGDIHGFITPIDLQPIPELEHMNDKLIQWKGHSHKIISMAINRNNTVLASASTDSSIVVWDVKSGRELRRIKVDSEASGLLFHPAVNNINATIVKPELQLKPLKKSVVPDLGSLELTIMKSVDMEVKGSQESIVNNRTNEEVEQLRVVNKQLFEAFIKLINSQNRHGS